MEDSSNMKKNSPINPHFFQPLLQGFQSIFSIPKPFLKYIGEEHEEEANEKIYMLRNKRVKSSNNYWLVKVCYFDGKLHFKDGWETFCNDHGLEEGDFLVFQHHQNFVFDVFVFDPTCCERPFGDFHHPTINKVKSSSLNNPRIKGFFKNGKGLKKNKNHKVYSTSKATFKPREFPYCETFVKPYCLTWGGMPLPNKFARENDLVNKCCEMVLKDQQGKEWTVSLRSCKKGRSAYIGRWINFHNEHDLKTGDSVVFELIEPGETPTMNFYQYNESDWI